MENNVNAYCTICGKGYHVCNASLEEKAFRPWRTVTDTIGHYKVYLALHDYTLTKDKEKGRLALSGCDLSDFDVYLPEIRKAIHEIRNN